MAPRLRLRLQRALTSSAPREAQFICRQCRHASLATATTPAPPPHQTITSAPPIARFPRTQPPSHKPPEFRKSQLHRQYQSLLRSSPLIVIFQHNNLKATEWIGIRRELASALNKVDEEMAKASDTEFVGAETKLQVVQTGMFAAALKVVEFWNPKFEDDDAAPRVIGPSDPKTPTSTSVTDSKGDRTDPTLKHGLSEQAWLAAKKSRKIKHGLEPILSGPLVLLTLPTVSPQHLKAALSILSPSKDFPAPKRKTNPSYHEAPVQAGVQKLLLLAARIEGKVFDMDGARWVGGIEGGVDGLRGQLVAMLQGIGAGVTGTLEAASRSLYVTVEGRRGMLEEEERGDQGSS